MKTLKKFFFSFLLLVFLYVFCALFNYLPDSISPRVLFKDQYQQLMHALSRDASSQSATAKMSKQIYDLLNKSPDSATATTANQDTADEEVQKPASPIDKAKAAAQDYENKIADQKEMLDKL